MPKFQKYVVCKKIVIEFISSQTVGGYKGSLTSKLCTFQQFPMHPHVRMRKQCGTILLKTVEYASGVTYVYPRLTYCYLGLKVSMQ